jgi:hypothetical protein
MPVDTAGPAGQSDRTDSTAQADQRFARKVSDISLQVDFVKSCHRDHDESAKKLAGKIMEERLPCVSG